jgi:ankyrin repeat protein
LQTPLNLAAGMGRENAVMALLKAGANVNTVDETKKVRDAPFGFIAAC